MSVDPVCSAGPALAGPALAGPGVTAAGIPVAGIPARGVAVAAPAAPGVSVTAAVAHLLAGLGLAGVPGALALLADSLGAAEARVRLVPAAGSGEGVVHTSGVRRGAGPTAPRVEVPVRAGGRVLGVLTVTGATQGCTVGLGAVADMLALCLAAHRDDAVSTAEAVYQAAEAALGDLAGRLHDGPAQALVAASYALQAGDASAGEAVAEALRDIRALLVDLRVPAGGKELAAGLATAGVQVGVEGVWEPETCSPAAGSALFRVVQGWVADARARGAGTVTVTLDRGPGGLRVDLDDDGAAGAGRHPRVGRACTVLAALGGQVSRDPDGGMHLVVPTSPPPASASRARAGAADRARVELGR